MLEVYLEIKLIGMLYYTNQIILRNTKEILL